MTPPDKETTHRNFTVQHSAVPQYRDFQGHIKTLLSTLASHEVYISLCPPSALHVHPRAFKRQQKTMVARIFAHSPVPNTEMYCSFR